MKKQNVRRSGNIVVLIAILLPVLIGMGAFAIDIGYIAYMCSQAQAGADSAALACVEELAGDQATLDSVASHCVSLNAPDGVTLEVVTEAGTWDAATATFTPDATPASFLDCNAVRVSVLRPNSSLFFGPLLDTSSVDVEGWAVATKSSGIGTRFLIDDEMIDKDVPAIEDLADSLGRDAEELVTPRGFNQGKEYGDSNWTWEDNFLDMPAGEVLSLPTGQGTSYNNNDAGMFDIDHPAFPFTEDDPFFEFLMYSESGNDPSKWGTDYSHIKDQMDPLPGVAPVTDSSIYETYVNPDFIHVSPVTFSDVSTLNMQSGVPQVNAKGLRRGLIAFKIIAVGVDIDGTGSVLPELVIEIVDPATIDPNDVRHFSQQTGGKPSLVQ